MARKYESIYEQAIQTAKLDVQKIVNGDDDSNIDVYNVDNNDNAIQEDVFENFHDDLDIRQWNDDENDENVHTGGIMFWELPNTTSTPTLPGDRDERHIRWKHDLDSNVKSSSEGENDEEDVAKKAKIEKKKKKKKKTEKGMKCNDDDGHDWFAFLEKSARKERNISNNPQSAQRVG